MVVELKQAKRAAKLFAGWQETIIWSCLQGVMGTLYVDDPQHPASAMALLGDFCFLAGKPNQELLLHESGREFQILVPKEEDFARLIEECFGERAVKVVRYAMKKEPEAFDQERLKKIVDGLPKGYTIEGIEETLFNRCREISWCKDWVSQYDDYNMYQKHGLGVVIMRGEEPVSGASSYSGYLEGIEVEIDTRADYRRRGLAAVCGAELILRCLERGWYPSWDAQNLWSVALAEKLGYHLDSAYTAYEVVRER